MAKSNTTSSVSKSNNTSSFSKINNSLRVVLLVGVVR